MPGLLGARNTWLLLFFLEVKVTVHVGCAMNTACKQLELNHPMIEKPVQVPWIGHLFGPKAFRHRMWGALRRQFLVRASQLAARNPEPCGRTSWFASGSHGRWRVDPPRADRAGPVRRTQGTGGTLRTIFPQHEHENTVYMRYVHSQITLEPASTQIVETDPGSLCLRCTTVLRY